MRKAKIYYNQDLAGHLTETDDGNYIFCYTTEYVERNPNQFLSFTMPVTIQPFISKRLFPFFEGLLPEGWLLDIATKKWKLNSMGYDSEEITVLDGLMMNLSPMHFHKLTETILEEMEV